MIRPNFRRIESYDSAEKIRRYFIDKYGCDIVEKGRQANKVIFKRLYIMYMREELGETTGPIGHFINLDHSTVTVGYQRMKYLLERDTQLAEDYRKLCYHMDSDIYEVPKEHQMKNKLEKYSKDNLEMMSQVANWRKDIERYKKATMHAEKRYADLLKEFNHVRRENREYYSEIKRLRK